MTETDARLQRTVRSLVDRLIVGGAWVMAGRLVMSSGSLVLSVLLARLLHAEDVGTYFLGFSLVTVSALAARGGLEKSMLSLVADSLAHGAEARAKSAIRLVATLAALGVTTVCALVLLFGARVATDALSSARLARIVPWLLPWVVFVAAEVVIADTYRAFGRLDLASVFGGASSRLGAIACLLCVLLVGEGSLNLVVLIVVATGCLMLFPAMRGLVSLYRRLGSDGSSAYGVRDVAYVAWPLYFSALLFYVVAESGLWIVSSFANEAEVALYGVALRLVLLVALPLAIVDAVLPPFISELSVSGDKATLELVLRSASAVAAIPAALVLIVFVAFGEPILSAVFGDFYGGASHILAALSIGHIVNVWSGSCGFVLIMAGHQRDYLLVAVVAAALTLGGGILLAGVFGTIGVAAATAAGLGFSQVAAVFIARRRVGVWTHASPTALIRLHRRRQSEGLIT